MFPCRILLSASIFFVASFAYIPSEEAKFNIFDSELLEFERDVSSHVYNFEPLFKNEKNEDNLLVAIERALGNIKKMLNGDWKDSFLKATASADGTTAVELLNNLFEDLRLEVSKFKQIVLFRESLGPEIVAKLAAILQKFNDKDYLFRKHPLISSPILIELALVVALFNPISKGLPENEISKYRLPCLAYDLLFEYREFAVDSRLDKLGTMLVRDDEKHKIGVEDMKDIAAQDIEYKLFKKR